jgi:hypothetical protein
MSGCVHCVYTIYAEELTAYTTSLSLARDALLSDGIPQTEWPEGVREGEEGNATPDSGVGLALGLGSVGAGASNSTGLDTGMTAFMESVLSSVCGLSRTRQCTRTDTLR